MTQSIWRYSHLALAIVSSLFLILASITGVILAIEPITHQVKGFDVQELESISLGNTIENLQANYDEVFSIEVEKSGFVKASVLSSDLETLDVYVNATTGKQLTVIKDRPFIYSFATNLHRSLFLKTVGRFFVGLISLLFFLIAITGLFLLARRQGGFKRLFSKVQKDYFELKYHVVLSRWFFIPLLIISSTGVYLSVEKFDLLPDVVTTTQYHKIDTDAKKFNSIKEIPFFREITLNQIKMVEFPFSNEPDDYFQISLRDMTIEVSQETGQIITSTPYPFAQMASQWSWNLHTGEGNVLWSIILLLASASILFFIYSGVSMFIKRKKKVSITRVMPDKHDCKFVILVGSETGTTYDFARILYNSLTTLGNKVFLTDLNNYSAFAKAEHIFILTATYGDGEPPANAWKFETLLSRVKQPNEINYAVVGFGSLEYPKYCHYAAQVDQFLGNKSNFKSLLPIYKSIMQTS